MKILKVSALMASAFIIYGFIVGGISLSIKNGEMHPALYIGLGFWAFWIFVYTVELWFRE